MGYLEKPPITELPPTISELEQIEWYISTLADHTYIDTLSEYATEITTMQSGINHTHLDLEKQRRNHTFEELCRLATDSLQDL